MVVLSLALFAFAAVTLWWTMHAWRTPETLAATRFPAPDGTHALAFSLLRPARHEEAVLEPTVARLFESTHTGFEVIIVGHDDPGTAEVARRLAQSRPGRVFVVTDTNERKNKPRALNSALPYCLAPTARGSTPTTIAPPADPATSTTALLIMTPRPWSVRFASRRLMIDAVGGRRRYRRRPVGAVR